jgi:hypothetical protein
VYLVNVPNGKASLRTKPVVEFGSRFFFCPAEIRCWRQSKNTCGAWNTSGSGLPEVEIWRFVGDCTVSDCFPDFLSGGSLINQMSLLFYV